MILPDINVWLALAFDQHQYYSSAAFSMAGNYELVTFDKGFSQYKNLRHTILS